MGQGSRQNVTFSCPSPDIGNWPHEAARFVADRWEVNGGHVSTTHWPFGQINRPYNGKTNNVACFIWNVAITQSTWCDETKFCLLQVNGAQFEYMYFLVFIFTIELALPIIKVNTLIQYMLVKTIICSLKNGFESTHSLFLSYFYKENIVTINICSYKLNTSQWL